MTASSACVVSSTSSASSIVVPTSLTTPMAAPLASLHGQPEMAIQESSSTSARQQCAVTTYSSSFAAPSARHTARQRRIFESSPLYTENRFSALETAFPCSHSGNSVAPSATLTEFPPLPPPKPRWADEVISDDEEMLLGPSCFSSSSPSCSARGQKITQKVVPTATAVTPYSRRVASKYASSRSATTPTYTSRMSQQATPRRNLSCARTAPLLPTPTTEYYTSRGSPLSFVPPPPPPQPLTPTFSCAPPHSRGKGAKKRTASVASVRTVTFAAPLAAGTRGLEGNKSYRAATTGVFTKPFSKKTKLPKTTTGPTQGKLCAHGVPINAYVHGVPVTCAFCLRNSTSGIVNSPAASSAQTVTTKSPFLNHFYCRASVAFSPEPRPIVSLSTNDSAFPTVRSALCEQNSGESGCGSDGISDMLRALSRLRARQASTECSSSDTLQTHTRDTDVLIMLLIHELTAVLCERRTVLTTDGDGSAFLHIIQDCVSRMLSGQFVPKGTERISWPDMLFNVQVSVARIASDVMRRMADNGQLATNYQPPQPRMWPIPLRQATPPPTSPTAFLWGALCELRSLETDGNLTTPFAQQEAARRVWSTHTNVDTSQLRFCVDPTPPPTSTPTYTHSSPPLTPAFTSALRDGTLLAKLLETPRVTLLSLAQKYMCAPSLCEEDMMIQRVLQGTIGIIRSSEPPTTTTTDMGTAACLPFGSSPSSAAFATSTSVDKVTVSPSSHTNVHVRSDRVAPAIGQSASRLRTRMSPPIMNAQHMLFCAMCCCVFSSIGTSAITEQYSLIADHHDWMTGAATVSVALFLLLLVLFCCRFAFSFFLRLRNSKRMFGAAPNRDGDMCAKTQLHDVQSSRSDVSIDDSSQCSDVCVDDDVRNTRMFIHDVAHASEPPQGSTPPSSSTSSSAATGSASSSTSSSDTASLQFGDRFSNVHMHTHPTVRSAHTAPFSSPPTSSVITEANSIPLRDAVSGASPDWMADVTNQLMQRLVSAMSQGIASIGNEGSGHALPSPTPAASSSNRSYAGYGTQPSRAYTQLKDFKLQNVKCLEQSLLADPEQWFLDFEKVLTAQNVHPCDYVSCLLNSCCPALRDAIAARSSDVCGDYTSLRHFISDTYGTRLPLAYYIEKLWEKPDGPRTVAQHLEYIQKCKTKYERAFERLNTSCGADVHPSPKICDEFCLRALTNFLSPTAPALVAMVTRKYHRGDLSYNDISDLVYQELLNDPEIRKHDERVQGKTVASVGPAFSASHHGNTKRDIIMRVLRRCGRLRLRRASTISAHSVLYQCYSCQHTPRCACDD
eukprot:GHVQ01029955.1.p1 GENE.GHVQ01029955.1~~GHVQ01029955.1.p1  ORF type:complete len:1298 (+),score=181.83 GHVQ01029955.1:259-4152(+)